MTDDKGEPWFVGSDVCDALGYSNGRDAVRKHVEKDDVTKRDTIDALGRVQLTTFINESGLYALILSSKPREGGSCRLSYFFVPLPSEDIID